MLRRMSTTSVTYRTRPLRTSPWGEASVTDRQEKLAGFSQEHLAQARIIMVGAGGLGGEIGEGLVRKGIGTLEILDDDRVEPSNLNRQRFYRRDLGKPKATSLAKNLDYESFCGSVIYGHPLSLQDAAAQGVDMRGDVVVVGVDNNPTRVFAATFFGSQDIPVIFTAVSRTANNGYVFVQESGSPCFGYLFPDAMNDETYPCPGTPAIKDILKVVAGIVLYAVDTLLMARLRCWNYKEVFLDGSVPDSTRQIARRNGCPLCACMTKETQTPWRR